jgi:hypothetical protein
MARSIGSGAEAFATFKIPNLADLPTYNGGGIECPFCFQIKRFKNECTWRKHVFADLRSYVCTNKDCDSPCFRDINEWFQHEMTVHRVTWRCFLCPNTTCNEKDQFVSHLQRYHGEHDLDGKEQQARRLARDPHPGNRRAYYRPRWASSVDPAVPPPVAEVYNHPASLHH